MVWLSLLLDLCLGVVVLCGGAHIQTMAHALGAFAKGSTSDAAKQLWSRHLGFAQGRLDISAGIGGERLRTAPPLPMPGSGEDPGQLLKDWNYYKYRPNSSMASSLNKFGPEFRWPGLNNAPQIRHHLTLVKRPQPKRNFDQRYFTDLPRMEAGPGMDYINKRLDAEAADAKRRTDAFIYHRSNMKASMAGTMERREQLQMRAFSEPAFGGR